jgi:uncharacterized protein
MNIQRDEHGRKGAFYIEEDGEWIAEMTYVRSADGQITIDHTEVEPELREKGIGTSLVAEAVKYARENGLKIGAKCPFAKKVLQETAEFKDVSV